METTINEIVQLSWLLVDIGVPITTPTRLYCDEKSVIQIARNLVFHEWTKHIDINCHTTRRKLQLRTMTLFFVFSSMQIVDFFTKSQIVQRFFFFLANSRCFLLLLRNLFLKPFVNKTLLFFFFFFFIIFANLTIITISNLQPQDDIYFGVAFTKIAKINVRYHDASKIMSTSLFQEYEK